MKIRTVYIMDEGVHKVLILDDNRTKQEGKLLAWVEGKTETDARAEAKDVTEAIHRNGKLVWH